MNRKCAIKFWGRNFKQKRKIFTDNKLFSFPCQLSTWFISYGGKKNHFYLITIVNIKIRSLNFFSKTTYCPFK